MTTSTHPHTTTERRARQPPPRPRAGEPKPLRLDYVPPERERLLVRINEAAAMLACDRREVYRLLAGGEVETIGSGRSRRVIVESLRAYVERAREASRLEQHA